MPGVTIKTRNVSAVIANLGRYGEDAKARAKVAVKESGERLYNASQALCPVDTGYMKEHERLEYTPLGFGYRVGFEAADFPGEFYPKFVLWGTRFMAGRDFLFAPAAEERQRFRQELRQALNPKQRRASAPTA